MSPSSSLTVWLADLTYTQQTIAADVIPNAIGCIAVYAEKILPLAQKIRLFKYPEKLIAALQSNQRPDIIGFTNYVWNGALSSSFAQAIKTAWPDTIIVFGGPNYPTDEAEQIAYLRRHPEVDFHIIREGETAFANLLQILIEENGDIERVRQRTLPSIHYLSASGEPILNQANHPPLDLAQLPSPYSLRRMDEFFDGQLLPIIQTNRGCPFSCTFCVEGDPYFSKIRHFPQERISAELDYIGAKMLELREKGGRNDLFIADSNFGMFQEDLETARAIARTRKQYRWPEYINVATGKNNKERVLEVSKIIEGAMRLSGSVQSLDPTVLENIKRKNIDAQALFDLGLKAEKVGANTYSEIILALPGDSLKAHCATIKTIVNAGFTNIFLFQLMLLPGTEMATQISKEQHSMITKYRVIPRCYGRYELSGKPILAAEIEEICVANATLSFDDYLAARKFHLVITLFYNDGIFALLLKMLRRLELPIYRWLELLDQSPLPPKLSQLFDSFLKATRDELWDSHQELAAFIHQPGTIEQYIAGERGNNLLFVHKTLAIINNIDELAEVARTTLVRYVRESGRTTPEILAFINEALNYHCARARHLFFDRNQSPTLTLHYDLEKFAQDNRPLGVGCYLLPKPTVYRFILDQTQQELIERYLGIYGDTPVAIGRILSKVHVKKLYRHAVPESGISRVSPSAPRNL